jgi:hypothetical protein
MARYEITDPGVTLKNVQGEDLGVNQIVVVEADSQGEAIQFFLLGTPPGPQRAAKAQRIRVEAVEVPKAGE